MEVVKGILDFRRHVNKTIQQTLKLILLDNTFKFVWIAYLMQQFYLITCRGKLKKLCLTSPVLYVYPVLKLKMLFAQSSKIPLQKVSYPDIQLINVSYM